MASDPTTHTYPPKPKPNKARSKSRTRFHDSRSLGGGACAPIPSPSSSIAPALDEIAATLECPVCFDQMRAPIFMCAVGHNLCEACKRHLGAAGLCPVCRAPLSGQRNFALERIAENFDTPCENAQHGCPFVARAGPERASASARHSAVCQFERRPCENAPHGCPFVARAGPERVSASARHSAVCQFKRRPCPIGVALRQCAWTGPRAELVDHFRRAHPDKLAFAPGREVAIPNFVTSCANGDVQLIAHAGELFVYRLSVNPAAGCADWALQLVSGDDEAARRWLYEFDFVARGPRGAGMTLRSANECTATDEVNINTLFASGECLSVPLKTLQRLMLPDSVLKFTFYLFTKENKANRGNRRDN